MSYDIAPEIWVNTGSDKGVLAESTKPEPMLTFQWGDLPKTNFTQSAQDMTS